MRMLMGCCLLAFSVWLVLPNRNVYGNPSMEDQLSSCNLPSGAVVRLYKGNGGATTSYWYSLTHEGGLFEREKQIAFAYSSPVFTAVACNGDEMTLSSSASDESFTAAQLGDLRQHPKIYWKEKLEGTGPQKSPDLMDAIQFIGAAALFVDAIFLIKQGVWRNR
ncbi:MAG: hypothetical protein AB7I35_07200 [Ramlibacter sp.]